MHLISISIPNPYIQLFYLSFIYLSIIDILMQPVPTPISKKFISFLEFYY